MMHCIGVQLFWESTKKTVFLTLLGVASISCVNEDYFGKSPYGIIRDITVSNQSGNAHINSDSLLISVDIHDGTDLSNIVIEFLDISPFATTEKGKGDTLNLLEEGRIRVVAENGNEFNWIIKAHIASVTPQLQNGNMNSWYLTTKNFYEPGENELNTIWGTGNPGTQIMNKLATVPKDLGEDNLAARMETLDLGVLGETFGTPIAAGSLFTGYFDPDELDFSDPQAAIEFGAAFSGRPKKIRFKYKYSAGEINKDRNGNVLEYGDACDIYALLEIKNGGHTERMATAWFRSEENQLDLVEQEIDFIYGALDSSFPSYMKPEPEDYVSDDIAKYGLPTHITFVASSSFDGVNFSGAVGSELIIDDIILIYD